MSTSLWPAPYAVDPLDAVVRLPGSKSITARALVLGALADGPSTMENALVARDSDLMVAGLRALGADVDTAAERWTVRPAPLRAADVIDCGLSGTVMRFLPVVAALARGPTTFTGDAYASARPLAPLVDALRSLGVPVDVTGSGLPVTVHGTGGVAGGDVTLDATSSSQFVSALLLAAPRFAGPTTIRARGQVPSLPYLDMTVSMLRARGVSVTIERAADGLTWRVEPGPLAAAHEVVEPDLPNAAPFLAAALVAGGTVRIPAWPQTTVQAGDRMRMLCAELGAQVELQPAGLVVSAPGATRAAYAGFDVDLSDASELVPVVAALAAFATSPCRIRGVAHIRGHETDRLAALATELGNLGGDATVDPDGLTIVPRPLHAGVVSTYDDHRMVMFGAVLGLGVRHVEVANLGAVSKTLPGFAALWRDLLRRPEDAA